MNKRLISYASDYVSFLLDGLSEIELSNVKNIILFGSVARGDSDKNSDIDIFIDVIDKKERIEESVKKNTKDFFKSIKFKEYWKLMGIDRNIRTITDKLDSWKDLKENIILNGITLYGKFEEKINKNNQMILFQWDSIKNNSKRILLSKRLFGYKQYNKRYHGLVKKFNGEKLGANSVLVPIEHYRKILKIFREMGIKVQMREILM